MRFSLVYLLLILFPIISFCQDGDFKWGATYKELGLTEFPQDTTAEALVINEFGYARFENSPEAPLLVDYHVKIKILKPEGTKYGSIAIWLYKNGIRAESLREIKASSYRMVNGSMVASEMDSKAIITENHDKNYTVKKLVIPNVTVGSIVEYSYTMVTPFDHNFHTWEFQDMIPKLKSEYWADIPANYIYNITLRGFLKLDKNDSKIIRGCYKPQAYESDCSRLMWGMVNIPAFKVEDYMTAAKNFISAIHFELSEYHSFTGTKNKITKEWKDVAEELKQNEHFGVELRKARGVADKQLEPLIATEVDVLGKAKIIHAFVRDWYIWNGDVRMFSDGVKKAFDEKRGNSADINMTLIGALKHEDFNVEPVILSTRSHGMVSTLNPVITDFNYVIARLTIGDKVYLLDATDQFAPFGMLPERCLNGQGRVLGEKETYWIDLKATDKKKTITVGNFKLTPEGQFKGSLQTSYYGYSAVRERKDIQAEGGEKEYMQEVEKGWKNLTITSHEILNKDDISKPLIVKAEVDVSNFDGNTPTILFNPNVTREWDSNPFKSADRLYPVDYGAPLDETVILNYEFPPDLKLDEALEKIGLALPNNGGRFTYEVSQPAPGKISVTSALIITKPIFTSDEYHYLREIFNRVVVAHNSELVLTRSK